MREERDVALTLAWRAPDKWRRRGGCAAVWPAGVPGVELTIASCPVRVAYQAFALGEEPLEKRDDLLV